MTTITIPTEYHVMAEDGRLVNKRPISTQYIAEKYAQLLSSKNNGSLFCVFQLKACFGNNHKISTTNENT